MKPMTRQHVKAFRKAHGLSLRALAQETNGMVSYGTIRNFEEGRIKQMRPAQFKVLEDVVAKLEMKAA